MKRRLKNLSYRYALALVLNLISAPLAHGLFAPTGTLEGKVLSFNEHEVVLEQNGERIKVPRSQIVSKEKLVTGQKMRLEFRSESLNSVEVPQNFQKK